MNSLGRTSRFLFLTALVGLTFWQTHPARAQDGVAPEGQTQDATEPTQEDPPDEFIFRLADGERRLDGTIRSINWARGTFVLDTKSMSYPSGLPKLYDVPARLLIQPNSTTWVHARGSDEEGVSVKDLRVGESAVIIGVFSQGAQNWAAKEIALWTSKDASGYILDGFTVRKPVPAGSGGASTTLQSNQEKTGSVNANWPVKTPSNSESGSLERIGQLNASGKGVPFPFPKGAIATWSGEKADTVAAGPAHGTPQGSVTFEPGLVGSALGFDGASSRLVVRDNPQFALTKSLTCEGWVFVKSSTRPGVIFMRGDVRPSLDPYSLTLLPNGQLRFRVSSTDDNADLTTKLPMRTWVHIATTLDSDTGAMRLYLNGEVAAETQTDLRPLKDLQADKGAAITIGNTATSAKTPFNMPFHGLIDEWSLYNRALTADEIKGIFQAGAAGKTKVARVGLPSPA